MDKRFQVFISSTFLDLKPARQEVSQALLRTGCFPAGMELFPAADEEQLEFIKAIIDESDYYIVISAGRYGAIEPRTQKSYTELEYDYAVSIKKPIIRFLHRDPFKTLLGEHIEQSDEGKMRLEAFRNKMMADRLVCFWEHPRELGAEIILALDHLKRSKPAQGWVRGDIQRPTSTARPDGYPKGYEVAPPAPRPPVTELRVPTLGESVEEATVSVWFKTVGQYVSVDEMVCELETDKVSVEVPSPAEGRIEQILAEEGSTVYPNGLLGKIRRATAG